MEILSGVKLKKEKKTPKRPFIFSGVMGTGKSKAWKEVTCDLPRTMPEVKRKWFDIKGKKKQKNISAHRKTNISATGGRGSLSKLSNTDKRIAALLGRALCQKSSLTETCRHWSQTQMVR